MNQKKTNTTAEFSAQYQSPHWQKKRLEILERDGFVCQSCFDNSSQLHVHHKTYTWGRKVWDYPNNTFITLCGECHELWHSLADDLGWVFSDAKMIVPLESIGVVADIMRGVLFFNPSELEKVLEFVEEVNS